MKVSTQWLADYVSLEDVNIEQLAEQITRSGIEIDSVENRNQGVSKVVVGFVKSKEKHPDADKLNICKVDVGAEEELQIVCGAKNVDAGQKVPVALVGAKMPGGLEIKKAKLRGALSQGMICSAKELGINDKLLPKEIQEGILVLPAETEVGTDVISLLGLDDQVLDFDLTPNRSDCLSMLGAAYEISAILGRELALPQPDKELTEGTEPTENFIKIGQHDAELCSHYAVRHISGVKIAPSPLWLQNRLIAAGIRPINNIVDVTNYVMLEYGQPLHAFDADTIAGQTIGVRKGVNKEKFVTLDGQERELDEHDLLIVDGNNAPIALAGVMGGLATEVTDQTVNLVLESAKFDGGTVRKTSRKLGLRSEASQRFEKEVDPARVIPALDRAAALIAKLAGGNIHKGIVEAVGTQQQPVVLQLTVNKVNDYLGTSITIEEIKGIFGRLHFDHKEVAQDTLEIVVPTRRGDIIRNVDLIEEIARLYGYDNIPVTAIEGPATLGGYTGAQQLRRNIREMLSYAGWFEVMGYSFIREGEALKFPQQSANHQEVKLAMPMSEDRSVIRSSLIPGLVDIATYNHNRKQNNLAIFEIGHVFQSEEVNLTKQPQEITLLSLLLSGEREEKSWNVSSQPVDFYDLKGAVEAIFIGLGIENSISYVADEPQGFHPGRSASIYLTTEQGKQHIGTLGQLHPEFQQEKELPDTYVAEISLESLYTHSGHVAVYKDLPRFPAMQRDIALVLDQNVEVDKLITLIKQEAGQLLEAVDVFDVFTGSKLGENKKSIAISLVYRHKERTLTDEEITTLHQKVVSSLEQTFNAELRK